MGSSCCDSFLNKLRVYLKENPGRCCDIAFIVGSTKEVVKTSQIMLEVACPAFKKLFDTWAEATVSKNAWPTPGIPLPRTDPEAFKLFLTLLFTDSANISVDALKKQNLENGDLLGAIELCEEFDMIDLNTTLQFLVNESIFDNFSAFAESDNFLKLSENNLRQIFKRDKLNVEETAVVKCALRWAEHQCSIKQKEKTGENLRLALGDSLSEIRFPAMSVTDFGNETRIKDVLKSEEQLEIFRYISLTDENKLRYNKSKLIYRTDRRIPEFSTVECFEDLIWATDPGFICDGSLTQNYVKINQKMEIFGFGFKGPVHEDSHYEVSIEIIKYNGPDEGKSYGKATKGVFARKSSMFHVLFDKPIVLEPSYGTFPRLGYWYTLRFSLKGAPTPALAIGDFIWKHIFVQKPDAGFYFEMYANPMAELHYKLVEP